MQGDTLEVGIAVGPDGTDSNSARLGVGFEAVRVGIAQSHRGIRVRLSPANSEYI